MSPNIPSSPISSRRRVLRLIAGSVVCLGTAQPDQLLVAAELPHLTDANPAAASLGYTEDSKSVDIRKFPTHQPEQRCSNCKFFQADASAQFAPCQLYPGNAVNANGWCGGYASK